MKRNNFIIGLFFIVAAAAVLLNQTELFANVKMWNIIISLLLIPVIISSIRVLDFWGIFFPLAIIAILFGDELHIEKFVPFPALVAALFLSIGCSMMFPAKRQTYQNIGAKQMGDASAETIFIKSNFLSTSKTIRSNNLKKVYIECKFGKTDVYLSDSQICDDTATIYVNAFCSSVRLYVPNNWTVENRLRNRAGYSDTSYSTDGTCQHKRLIVTGYSAMSSVKIMQV